jgi:hypothetical protein
LAGAHFLPLLRHSQAGVRGAVNGAGAGSGVKRARSATNVPAGSRSQKVEGPNQGGGEGGREFSLPGSLPCLPALSCADTGQGGNSQLAKAPQTPRISRGDYDPDGLPPSPCSPTLLITLGDCAGLRAAGTTSPLHSTLTPESRRYPGRSG